VEFGLTPATPPSPLPPVDATIKGSYGRAASVGVKRVVKSIDVTVVGNYYAAIADERLINHLTIMAQADTNRGIRVPGAIVEEEATIS